MEPNVLADALAQTEHESAYDFLHEVIDSVIDGLCKRLAAEAAGVSSFVEIGTGKVLSGLVKRTLTDAVIVNLDGADDLDSVLAEL